MRLAAALLVAAACGKGSGGSAAPPPAGPRADCGPLAEQLASLELGNYATAEVRAPIAAKWRDACAAERVTVDEAACIGRAKDTWAASQCAPRLFPALAAGDTSDCAAVVAKTRKAMLAQAAYLNDANIKAWFDTTMQVMQTSCVADHWPAALKRCMLAADLAAAGSNATAAFASCNHEMPPPLLQKLQQRMLDAMRATQPAAQP